MKNKRTGASQHLEGGQADRQKRGIVGGAKAREQKLFKVPPVPPDHGHLDAVLHPADKMDHLEVKDIRKALALWQVKGWYAAVAGPSGPISKGSCTARERRS